MTRKAATRPVLLCSMLLLTLVCASARAQAAPERPISLPNGDFARPLGAAAHAGWRLPSPGTGYDVRRETTTPPSILLTGTPKPGDTGSFGTMTQSLDAVPYRGQRVRLRAEVRALPSSLSGAAFLWLRVDRAGGRPGFFDNMADRPIAEDVWGTYEITGEVAADAQRIVFGLGLLGNGQARFRRLTLTDVGPVDLAAVNRWPIASLQGPGVLHFAMQAPVRALGTKPTGTVTIPMPGTYRDQVPLDFHVTALPAAALRGYRFQRRSDGRNWVCVATVTPPKRGMLLRWSGDILVFERPAARLPKAARPEVPAEAAAWTRSTACVQSRDAAIQTKARLLSEDAPDVETYVRRVVEFTSTNRGTGAKFDSLDAAQAMVCGGSCTSRANLAAALLRAHGIPARTIAHLPAWSAGQPLYEHWLTEYWHPGAGWVWIEPTLGLMQPSPTDAAVLSVSSPADEDRAFDPVHLRFVMPGAAYLSVCEFSPELTEANLLDSDAINTVRAAARLSGTPRQMAHLRISAERAFVRLMAQAASTVRAAYAPAILLAARTGYAPALSAVLDTGH